jgi:hypothetical protein
MNCKPLRKPERLPNGQIVIPPSNAGREPAPNASARSPESPLEEDRSARRSTRPLPASGSWKSDHRSDGAAHTRSGRQTLREVQGGRPRACSFDRRDPLFPPRANLPPRRWNPACRLPARPPCPAAQKLLQHGEPLCDVALACGFYDHAHLTRYSSRHRRHTHALQGCHLKSSSTSAHGSKRSRSRISSTVLRSARNAIPTRSRSAAGTRRLQRHSPCRD